MISLNIFSFTEICHCDLSIRGQFLGERSWARLSVKLFSALRRGILQNILIYPRSAFPCDPPRAPHGLVQLGKHKSIISHSQTFTCYWEYKITEDVSNKKLEEKHNNCLINEDSHPSALCTAENFESFMISQNAGGKLSLISIPLSKTTPQFLQILLLGFLSELCV